MHGVKGYAMRRLLRRLHIGEDITKHLSTFQRLGATMEVTPPRDVLPVGARTALRAVRTRAVVDISSGWLWPTWLEQQLDPRGESFVARGHLPVMQNVTARNWTAVGAAHSPWEGIVDPSGLVTPAFDSWSIDWWVRDADGWHFPSRESVEQRLEWAAPVVSTTLEVAEGTVVQRVYVVETIPEMVTVELDNRSPHPVEVAFAVRPYNPEGLAVVETLALEGHAVIVNNGAPLVLPAVPDRSVLSTYADGDVSGQLDDRGNGTARRVTCRSGLASGAFGFTLDPGEQMRVITPVAGQAPRSRRRVPWRRRARPAVPRATAMPSAAQVADDWHHRLRRGMQVELPDERLQQAVDANRATMLLLHDPGSITAGPFSYHRFWFRDAAYQVAALDRWGFHEEAADVLETYPKRQQRDGFFFSQWREWDANGAAIWTIAEHDRHTGDDELLERLAPSVERGVDWLERTCRDDAGKTEAARGLLPAGISAEHFGPYDYYFWDDLWAWRGLLDAAAIGRRVGNPALTDRAEAFAGELRDTLFAALQQAADRAGQRVITAGPTRGMDAGMIGGLAACYPLGLLDADDPWIDGTAEAIRRHHTIGPAFYQGIAHTGLGTYLTLQLAFVELFAGDPRSWERLEWLIDAATPTFTWPEAIHPRLGGGCMGDGHHGWMAADFLNFVRAVLVRETPDGLALLSILPPGWEGQRLAVNDAPTHHGVVSYQVTWEAKRARLRWQCDGDGVRLSAPGLDPQWSTKEPAGDVTFEP